MVCIEIRKRNRSKISQVSDLIKARAEIKIAYTVFLLTAAVFISSVPAVVFVVAGTFSPFFDAKSVFLWAEYFLQINSLVNPVLYFYRNNRYRKAVVKLLRFRKPQEIQPVPHIGSRARGHRDSVASIDVGGFVDSGRAPRHSRSQSYAPETHGHRKIGHGVSTGRVVNRRMSAPSLTSHGNLHDAQQSVTPTVTVPIEDAVKISNAAETYGHRNTWRGVSAGRVINRQMSALSLASSDNLRDAQQSVTLTVTVPIEDALSEDIE